MLDHGLVADPENARDLPVRLSAGGPHHALALAVRQLDRRRRKARSAHPPRGFECESADELKQRQMPFGERIVRGAREGAGAVGLAGNVGGDGEAVADPLAAGEIEDAPVVGAEDNHVGEPGPGEADAGDVARAMDRIRRAERLLVEPFGPAFGIIVDPDRCAAPAHVEMVRQREITEAEVPRNIGERAGKRFLASAVRERP